MGGGFASRSRSASSDSRIRAAAARSIKPNDSYRSTCSRIAAIAGISLLPALRCNGQLQAVQRGPINRVPQRGHLSASGGGFLNPRKTNAKKTQMPCPMSVMNSRATAIVRILASVRACRPPHFAGKIRNDSPAEKPWNQFQNRWGLSLSRPSF